MVCGREFERRPLERPSVFARRKRCGVWCRRVTSPDSTGRSRAEALFPVEQPCEVCGKAGKGRGVIDRHHRDSNRLNNDPSNIAFLCRRHHNAAHRVTDGKIGGGARPRVAKLTHDRGAARAAYARTLGALGWTTDQIASEMGVDRSSVLRYFREERYKDPAA